MVIVTSGKNKEGNPCSFYLDGGLKKQLDVARKRVLKKNWDYVAIVSGIPGSGKSTFVRTPARYCCPWFDEKYIVFSAEEFIIITNNCPEFSSIVLDESFQSLNTRVTMSPAFLRIINHLQLIRQKHLFIFLCLPNFFDLTKGVAVFRASHLFVTYASEEGDRGRFLAWGRKEKRKLYVKGSRFMDYFVVKSNMRGKYTWKGADEVVPEKIYEKMKKKHLLMQEEVFEERTSGKIKDWKLDYNLNSKLNLSTKEISALRDKNIRTIQQNIKNYKDYLEKHPKTLK